MRIKIVAILILLASPLACGAEPPNEKIVRDGISALIKGLTSNDEAVRRKAIDAVLPDERILRKIIGSDADILWPHMTEFVGELRSQTGDLKKEYSRHGALTEIELTELRGTQGQEWTAKVAKGIPLYRAALIYDKGSGVSSVYTVIDGKMYWIRGLDLFDRFIERLKNRQR